MVRRMLGLCLALLLAQSQPSQALRSVIDREWSWRLSEFPQLATSVGAHQFDDRLDRVDVPTQNRHLEHWRQISTDLAAIPRDALSLGERVDAAVLAEQVRASIAQIELRTYLFPVSGDSSFFSDLPQIARQHLFRDAADYQVYTRRLRDVPRYFEENLQLMREGLKAGLTTPRVILKGRDQAAQVHAEVKDPRESAFYVPFRSMPASIAPADAARLRSEGEAAIREAVIPAYQRVVAFLRETYVPQARTTIAASDLPGGRAYYRAQIREYVTKDIAPEELHALGQREVARIRAEMEAVKAEAGFRGDLPAFLQHLRTAPEFYARTPEELLMRASFIAKRIDGMLPHFFGLLPRLPYRVEAVPAAIAPFYTGGRYVQAAEGSGEPGTYWVNTYALKSRPLYVLPALTLHEAVPGHHLQIALAAEQTQRPPFRRSAYFSVYGEGWGLYSEKLGEEMGIYTTPYERFGRLTYEMWRACRLVVDTGMHALGWPREKALAFMKENTALSEHEIETEVDRYIGWPGQALSYKVGELAIRDLRARAEKKLGGKFDLKKFHDAVLALGSVPLTVMESEIGAAIESGALAR
jgi:uncharacterized protein (DUF885 family)